MNEDENRTGNAAEELIAKLLAASPEQFPSVRRRILSLGAELAVPALRSALERCTTWPDYRRVAFTLRRFNTDDALEALAASVRANSRYSGTAIRALELAGTTASLQVLQTLLECRPRRTKRGVARALARRKYAPAIRAIAQQIRMRNRQPDEGILAALGLYGRPEKLVRAVVHDDTQPPDGAADTLIVLEELWRPLRRVNLMRVLETLAREGPERARAVYVAYRDRTTLVRPSVREGDETLLRPASGAPDEDTERLVRPADASESAEGTGDHKHWWERVVQAVKNAIEDTAR